MAPVHLPITPNSAHTPLSIRKIYIQNLIDLLHACLLRNEIQRAKRAWAILIRCREINWRSRWRWGLALLTLPATHRGEGSREDVNTAQWLRALRVTVPTDEKPAVFHALILHLIRHSKYREALDELETYLTSYPYLLSAILHTYAGMLAFYLAQPNQENGENGMGNGNLEIFSFHNTIGGNKQAPNPNLLRQARGWFVRAIEIERDEVAMEYIRLIDHDGNDNISEMSDDEEMANPRRKPITPEISEDEDISEKGKDNTSEMSEEDDAPGQGGNGDMSGMSDDENDIPQPPHQPRQSSQTTPRPVRKEHRNTSLYNILHPDSDDDNHGLGSGASLLDSDDDGLADWRHELESQDGE